MVLHFWTKKITDAIFFYIFVIIVRGEVPEEDDMKDDLKKYIRMNTYIESKNTLFLQRLR
mgnify:CR=1 FL=1